MPTISTEKFQIVAPTPAHTCYIITANKPEMDEGFVSESEVTDYVTSIHPNLLPHFSTKYHNSTEPFTGILTTLDGDGVLGLIPLHPNHEEKVATLRAIRNATKKLKQLAQVHFDWTFHLVYPHAIDADVDSEEITKIMSSLPDNVILYWS